MCNFYQIAEKNQYAFGQYLNERIDPKLADGTSARNRQPQRTQDALRQLIGQAAPRLFALINKTRTSPIFARAMEQAQQGNIDAALECLIRNLNRDVVNQFQVISAQIPSDPRQDGGISRAVASCLGGLHNALQTHFALLRAGYIKLAERFKDTPVLMKQEFKKLITNITHTVKELSRVHAMTLKLIENQNGSKSNQPEPYMFDAANFELCTYEDQGPYLLPSMEFLDRIITLANKPNTMIFTSSPYDGRVDRENFAERYSAVLGCPIFGAKYKDSARTTHSAFDEYFATLNKLICDVIFSDSKK